MFLVLFLALKHSHVSNLFYMFFSISRKVTVYRVTEHDGSDRAPKDMPDSKICRKVKSLANI